MSLYTDTGYFSKFVVGIVGSEGAKFTPETEYKAKKIIREILTRPEVTGVASGACHLGGVDVWAEEIGRELGLDLFIYPPQVRSWELGYKPRNLQIVRASNEVHCITLKVLPPTYQRKNFDNIGCYHCHTTDHVKSGGCWTAKQAERKGKIAKWWVIE